MEISFKDLFPADPSIPRRNYCDACNANLGLRFEDVSLLVSGIQLEVKGLPMLHCRKCRVSYYPDRSRMALITLWERGDKQKARRVSCPRVKTNEKFEFTPIPFIYDSDDYYYIPGLIREHSIGFLTPVYFNKVVLVKFDSLDDYRLDFASATYGTIYTKSDYFSFGVNENGKVVMWLGDIAKLPESEQYYLRSENVPSDHLLGSEFYDAQIECIFTEITPQASFIEARSAFLDAALKYFKKPFSHLDLETIEAMNELNPPLTSTSREQKRLYDIINKIVLETLNAASLADLMKARNIDPAKLGNIKKLQALFLADFPAAPISEILCSFYVIYDLRVSTSHLISAAKQREMWESCLSRLKLPPDSSFERVYAELIVQTKKTYDDLTALMKQ